MNLRTRIAEGQRIVGVLLGVNSPDLAEILASLGFDYVMFDMEHGTINAQQLPHLVRAVERPGCIPLARVRDQQPKTILQALDAGVQGIMVPQVDTVEQAKAIIQAARYAPLGQRGMAPGTIANGWGAYGDPDSLQQLNERTTIIAQVESKQSAANASAIAAVPGIDAVLIGPADLSASLGFPGQVTHPRVQEVMQQVTRDACAAGCTVGTVAGSTAQLEELSQQGHSLFLATWLPLLRRGVHAAFGNVLGDEH